MGNKYTEAQAAATKKYLKNIGEYKLRVSKEEKEKYMNYAKSCGISLPSNSLMLDSFLLEICAPNPKPCLPVLEPIIFSIPSKAPPHINKIFVVSI